MNFNSLKLCFLLAIGIFVMPVLQGQKKEKKVIETPKIASSDSLKNVSLSGLKFRSIGPSITGGRIVDIAMNPKDNAEYYVASGHGSLWKTTNHGTTYFPVFDGQSSFAIGSVTIDPSNTNIVWVGTGENNGQTNVIYGDGVYKSEDGGASWNNMGLKNSEHIGGIVVDPNNSNIVFVAAYGPLRNEGGDRGIFKTVDGGKTWKNVLNISKYTGCFEVHMDPNHSNILYASAHQRLRKAYTSVGGGKESGVYRSIDGGETWDKMMSGLPTDNIGRIGLSVSPANSDVVYALVQAKEGSGFYKSENRAASWTKQGDYNSAYPFYMQKIIADPVDVNKIYSMDLLNQVSYDGGKNFSDLGEKLKHVDNHTMWIDPKQTKHLISGCDGGIYETWDGGENWDFKANMPIAEIYKVSTDNASPFYNVYIGTQDNSSLYGPSRTINSSGISNREWSFTATGDGFETQADWSDPNIIYSQAQFGSLSRYNRKNGELLYIQPTNLIDTAFRFDWDAPLLISKHNHNRLYFAANKVFRTNDQGNSWEVISPDLTRSVPQSMERIMDRSWSIDELASKGSLATLTTIAESPLDENIVYAGSGDGLIHITMDGGKNWKKASSVPGVQSFTKINQITASNHNKMIAYAACQAFTSGEFKPIVLKTIDGGETWTSITANLPEKGNSYTIVEDHINPKLLFVGTQFGLYMTVDGGGEWIKFMNGLPTTTIMDLEIQKRENDLVVSTFGRGVYILDDYSPLRLMQNQITGYGDTIFPIKDAPMYIEANPFAFKGAGFQGANFYAAANPAVGVTFSYFIKEEVKSLKKIRRDAEKVKQDKGEDIKYPTYDELKKEAEEQEAYLLFVIADTAGNEIRKLKTGIAKGVNRITWDFRSEPTKPITFTPFDDKYAWNLPDVGIMVMPGTYQVTLLKFDGKELKELVAPQLFNCVPLNNFTMSNADKAILKAFNAKAAEMSRVLGGADSYKDELKERIKYIKKAVLVSPNLSPQMTIQLTAMDQKLTDLNKVINGDNLRARYEGVSPPSIKTRIDEIVGALWTTTSAPTQTFIKSYELAEGQVEDVLKELQSISTSIEGIEKELEEKQVPYTPGRMPVWKKN